MTPQALRQKIIDTIWSGNGLPSAGVTSTTANVASPLASNSSNLLRTDAISTAMDNNAGTTLKTVNSHIFYPATANGRLAIHHTGHGGSYVAGQTEMVNALLDAGYVVASSHMPDAGAGSVAAHNAYPDATATLNYLKFFVETPTRIINQLGASNFSRIVMCGLSGGGFTTALVHAIDARIHRACAVAGSMPMLFVRDTDENPSGTDWEQNLPSLQFLDFHDLYALACQPSRRHLQILNTGDTSIGSYKSIATRGYSWHKQVAAKSAEYGGRYELMWDLMNDHVISSAARTRILNFFDEA